MVSMKCDIKCSALLHISLIVLFVLITNFVFVTNLEAYVHFGDYTSGTSYILKSRERAERCNFPMQTAENF